VTGQRGIDVEQIHEWEKRGQPELPDLIPVPDATGSFCRVEDGAPIVTVRNQGLAPDCGFMITVDANGDVVEANEANNTASGVCIGSSSALRRGEFSRDQEAHQHWPYFAAGLTRSARNSSQVRRPTARSGARLAPAR
jgi:hypothetical protein